MNLLKFSDPSRPMFGFRTEGPIAYSRLEVMGDPCRLLPESLWEAWLAFELRNHSRWHKWQTVWFMGIPLKVIVTGADGLWWGCEIDTATVIKLLKSDLEILKETYE